MATRRIAQETFDAVLQEKANRYHMDPSGEAVGEALQFKAQGKLKCLIGNQWGGGGQVRRHFRVRAGGFQSLYSYLLRGNEVFSGSAC